MTQDQTKDVAVEAVVSMRNAANFGDSLLLSQTGAARKNLDDINADMTDIVHVLKNCQHVTAENGWPCWAYHGVTLDGDGLVIVAAIRFNQVENNIKIKILRVWRE